MGAIDAIPRGERVLETAEQLRLREQPVRAILWAWGTARHEGNYHVSVTGLATHSLTSASEERAKARNSGGSMRSFIRALSLLLLPWAVGAQAPAVDHVTGTVVDAKGNPVAGAKVGTAFRLAPSFEATEILVGYGPSSVITDSKGTFSLPAAPIRYTKVLVAAGPDGSMGFVVRGAANTAQIRLQAAAKLDVEFVKDFGAIEQIGFDLMAAGSAVGYGDATAAVKRTLLVPAGPLEMHATTPESIASTSKLTFEASRTTPLKVTLRPTSWALNVGKPAPTFTPTDVRNLPPTESLDRLRGKWVLVDFWATWCAPCVKEMPKVTAFYETHAKMRDRFEIVAVHSVEEGESFEAIRPAYDRLVKNAWQGKPLPFPLVFDSTGSTQKRWGIEAYPTTLLVDPNGRLVGLSNIEDLARRLEQ
jgi:thiol-disulfide isomerase/thioredoxin